MSRYTTEIRYICEHYANVEHSTLAPDVFNVIDKSRKQIFDFPYPIFDENYREPLEKKILAHYYVREIGLETVGLWKLFLRNKMNEIMPYYNQLYESEKLKFNPLINEDNTTTHEREYGRKQDTADNTIVRVGENETTDSNENNQHNGINVKSNDHTEDVIHGHVVNTTDNKTNISDSANQENVGETGAKSSNEHTTDSDSGIMLDKDKELNEHKKSYDGYTESTDYGKTDTASGTDTTNYSGSVEQDYRPGAETKETTLTNHSVLTTHSDTPQGALDNFLAGKYMSDVTKEKYDPEGAGDVTKKEYMQGVDETKTTYGVDGVPRQDAVTHGKTSTLSGRDTKTISGDIVDTDNAHETKDLFDIKNSISNENDTRLTEKDGGETSVETSTDNSNTVNSGIDTTNRNGSESTAESTSDNTGFHSDKNKTSDSVTNDTGNLNINDTESYLTHLIGKSGSMTYSAMLNEFRSTFLNIDMMVIGELEELFMQIW